MTALDVLARLQSLGGKVWLEDGRVRCSAPAGVLTDDLREQLAAYKTEIADLLRAADNLKSREAIVPIQPDGSRPPLYAVPGHNGDVFCFVRLAQRLGPDQPFFGLQPPGLDGSRAPLARIEDLAAYFVEEIRRRQPDGPYLLAGYCMGGITAFEIARQLVDQGQQVGLLALLASSAPSAFTVTNRVKSETADWLRNRVVGMRALLTASAEERTGQLRAKAAALGRLFTPAEPSEPDPLVAFRERVERTTVEAAIQYGPAEYAGRVVVCLPSRADEHSYDRFADWQRFARDGMDVMAGPDGCRSEVMLKEPAVQVFADFLQACIERAALAHAAVVPAGRRAAAEPAGLHPRRQQAGA